MRSAIKPAIKVMLVCGISAFRVVFMIVSGYVYGNSPKFAKLMHGHEYLTTKALELWVAKEFKIRTRGKEM